MEVSQMTTNAKPLELVVLDPHHEGACEWKWDGAHLWQKDRAVTKWNEVKRIHPTPARIAALNSIMNSDHLTRLADLEKEVEGLRANALEAKGQIEWMDIEKNKLRRCLGFFASVIKSGEPWTDTCQNEYDAVRSQTT
jgi:hypothetical protein